MSSVAISGNASGAGVLTIAAPNTANNYTLTLPAETGTVITTGTTSGINATGLTTGTVPKARLPAGSLIQVARYDTGALATGTATIPIDDTIPQITEGTEFMTLAITPTSATNTLIIYVVINTSANLTQYNTIALFQDSTANALASATVHQQNSGTIMTNFSWKMTAGTTSSTTFRVRAGCGAAATTTFNGATSARLNGGTMASSITIFEVAV